MKELSFGSPVLLKKLRKEFGSLPSNRIKMRSSKDVSQFLKKVTYKGAQTFFQKDMLAQIEKTWDRWLGPLVSNLPPYKKVIRELRPQIEKLIK